MGHTDRRVECRPPKGGIEGWILGVIIFNMVKPYFKAAFLRPFFFLSLALVAASCAFPERASNEEPATITPSPAAVESTPPGLETASPPPQVPQACQEDSYYEQRLDMVNDTIVARGIVNPDVLRAMGCAPRHEFVPPEYLDQAYEDHPLPIGYGQTISQPYMVAWMTELIELNPGEKVLEIGTGSGYQAAVLAELGEIEVYSIEIVPELAKSAGEKLADLGYKDVYLIQGDGYYGWPEHILFDAIIVTAAPDHVPAPLAAQLVEGGRMVIPIGPPGSYQTLWKFVKQGGELTAYNLGAVAFVPFTGEGVQQAPTATAP
jgi:protein-L-isoaspartate(D-aspartate) O-methyltransferase